EKRGGVSDSGVREGAEGVMTGGQDNVAKYGGLAEYTLNVDTQKLGLWPGGFLNVIAMSGYGQSVNKASGALVPPDFIGLLPQPGENATGLMSLTYTQFLNKFFALYAGKLEGFSGDDNAFAHDFHSQFLN